jgi:gamma-glutamylcyclotransferase (GGCT)/AIG2-like uncharacterized protein YtfP
VPAAASRYNPRVARRPGYASAIHDVVDRLFVYGTLRSGHTARSLIQDHVVDSVPARTTGRLVAFPDYPGVVDEGTAPVHGELVQLRDLAAAFALLDAYEGNDFIRVLKKVVLPDGAEAWAWCYVLADPRLAEDGVPVTGGDWAAWLAGNC